MQPEQRQEVNQHNAVRKPLLIIFNEDVIVVNISYRYCLGKI